MLTGIVQLLATTALIMGGTDHPLSTPPDSIAFVDGYMDDAVDNYIDPDPNTDLSINKVAVITPEQFFPAFGSMTFDDSVQEGRDNLNNCVAGAASCEYNESAALGSEAPQEGDNFIVFGYSQSAVIASLVKRDLMKIPAAQAPNVSFVLLSNAMRPNGGILARGFEGMTIPILGVTFHGPTPTDSCEESGPCYRTVDVAQQYDFMGGDAPVAPLNVVAMANSLAAYYYLHGAVPQKSLDDPNVIDQGEFGDTQYYLIPAERLPLLMPFEQAGVPAPILAVLDAPLRVIVEAGYDRESSPGEHVQFRLLPIGDPFRFLVNLARSVPVGIDDGLQEAGLGRALGTEDVFRPYGVGGEELPQPGDTADDEPALEASGADATAGNAEVPSEPVGSEPPAGPAANGVADGGPLDQREGDQLGTPSGDPVVPAAPAEVKERRLSSVIRGLTERDEADAPKLPSVRLPGERVVRRVVESVTGQRLQRPDDAGGAAEGGTDAASSAGAAESDPGAA
ncbi:PE-PPE domain-containing protein [Mycobacterium sp. IS-1496]|uniref:PE-PPE domain-containing protein n=1 Tax=Mycobacterium sp. IS-1496 TaxID=1772284 RepID=UPI002570D515|nr:PE-PPE domain-containing protein [Mycobacterium sp. IS-1496]